MRFALSILLFANQFGNLFDLALPFGFFLHENLKFFFLQFWMPFNFKHFSLRRNCNKIKLQIDSGEWQWVANRGKLLDIFSTVNGKSQIFDVVQTQKFSIITNTFVWFNLFEFDSKMFLSWTHLLLKWWRHFFDQSSPLSDWMKNFQEINRIESRHQRSYFLSFFSFDQNEFWKPAKTGRKVVNKKDE